MQQLSLPEKKMYTRFELNLPLIGLDLKNRKEMRCSTYEISAGAIGAFSAQELSAGTDLEIWLCMPDNAEEIHTRGKVVRSEKITPEKYKIEIELDNADLKPMPLVLRIVQMKNRYYW
jgi:hypothetical protein